MPRRASEPVPKVESRNGKDDDDLKLGLTLTDSSSLSWEFQLEIVRAADSPWLPNPLGSGGLCMGCLY
jgi:hypothetical protein